MMMKKQTLIHEKSNPNSSTEPPSLVPTEPLSPKEPLFDDSDSSTEPLSLKTIFYDFDDFDGPSSPITIFDDFDDIDSSKVIENIHACEQLSSVAVSLGPDGRNKHVYSLFLSGLVDQHPAAKQLVLAAKEHLNKFGYGANLLVSIAWKLLEGAQELITNKGLNPSQIIHAYNKATSKLGEILQDLAETIDVRNKDQVILCMKAPLSSKLQHMEDILCPLIAEACIQVCPKNPLNFNADNVRIAKLLAASPGTFKGMLLKAVTVFGSIKRVENAKVLVIAANVGVDATATETNLIHECGNYARTEEAKVEELIKDSGAKVIVCGAGVGQAILQLCNCKKIMVLQIASQFELDCFCRTSDAVSLLKLGSTLDLSYLGHVDSILVEETPDSRVTVTNEKGGVATILLGVGASTISDEQLEGAVVKVVKSYKALCRDSRYVPGAGATEIEIARRLREFALREPGSSDQIAIEKYADSFELVPTTLAQNAGLRVDDIIQTLYADHAAGNVKVGIDLKNEDCKDASTLNIWDLYITKFHALEYAADVACNALRVYQVQEPQGPFDHLMAEHRTSDQFLWTHEFPTRKLISIFYDSICTLQPKREIEIVALTSHKDKLYKLSSTGMLSSIDIHSGEDCWSIPAYIALDLDFPKKSSDCSYYVDSSRVFMRTWETKPVDFEDHKHLVAENRDKLFDEEITASRLTTQKFVDPVEGWFISPSSSDCEEIICVGFVYCQQVGYKPWTSDILWYERVATFYIWIVGREEGVRLCWKYVLRIYEGSVAPTIIM